MPDDVTLAGDGRRSPEALERAGSSADETLAGPTPRRRINEPIARGAAVGRYVVLDELGAGGMGVVYAAYDPELDRKVAIKLLHPGGGHSTEGRTRLVREAQALAKLSHPNVVAVHDVGAMGDRVWMAMEFVTGHTLTDWLGERARPWPEVLRVMVAAGEGLVAAHEAGLLHRDFKPDNVMIDAGGRVRVMDFGLARADLESSGERMVEVAPELVARSGPISLASRVTQAGSLMGTPGYMSPEQYAGHDVDAKSDQFSFCIALWEALYGRRPFDADDIFELAAKVIAGERERPPADRRVPTWLRRACERGLATDPAHRFASMRQLLSSLARGRTRAGRKLGLAGAGALVLSGAAALLVDDWQHARQVEACEAEGAEIAEVWNDEARDRVRQGILATGVSHAPTTADKVMPWLDDAAASWREHRTQACLHAKVEQRWSDDLLDRAQWCLHERRLALGSLAQVLSEADQEVAAYAVQAATRLEPSDACTDADALQRSPSPPEPELRPRVVAGLAELERARALLRANRLPQGLAVMAGIRDEVEALGWAPLSARAGVVEGLLLQGTGSFAQAEQAGVTAYLAAAEAGAWMEATDAAESLVSLVGRDKARRPEGRLWAEHARIAASYAGDPLGLHEAARLTSLAGIDLDVSAFDEARERYERSLEIQRAVLGPDHPAVGELLVDLGAVELSRGAIEDARRSFEQALPILEDALGSEHPIVARPLSNLGNIHFGAGDYAGATALYERVLAIESAVLPPDHPHLAATLDNLALVHIKLGDHERALALQTKALAMWERSVGPDHPSTALSLTILGQIHLARGQRDEAMAAYERAVAIFERHEGTQQSELDARFFVAQMLVIRGGDRERALALARSAQEGYRALGETGAQAVATVETWLERQGEAAR
jgi:tetratricopeptide (TPR) repeat protein